MCSFGGSLKSMLSLSGGHPKTIIAKCKIPIAKATKVHFLLSFYMIRLSFVYQGNKVFILSTLLPIACICILELASFAAALMLRRYSGTSVIGTHQRLTGAFSSREHTMVALVEEGYSPDHTISSFDMSHDTSFLPFTSVLCISINEYYFSYIGVLACAFVDTMTLHKTMDVLFLPSLTHILSITLCLLKCEHFVPSWSWHWG